MDKTISNWFECRAPKPYVDEVLKKITVPEDMAIDSDQLIGIEVELEKSNVRMNVKSAVWAAHADGSLRNGGLEWITVPITARQAPAALLELFKGGADQCCFTPRTSIHVHFNCCDLAKDTVLDMVMLYLHFERQLYAFVGKSRIKNIYCVPINETGLATKLLARRFDQVCTSWKKYTGMNLLPLTSKGTIEFRQMHGTSDANKISVWIRLLSRLFEFAKKQGTTAIRERLGQTWDVVSLAVLGEEIFQSDWKYLRFAAPPSLADCFTAKQAFLTGKEQSTINLASFQESPYYLFKG